MHHSNRFAREHEAPIMQAAADGELWKLWYTSVPRPTRPPPGSTRRSTCASGKGAMPFAVRANDSGNIVGSTRYFNVDAANRRLEIGHTWYAQRAQRTAINTECKLLLLTHGVRAAPLHRRGIPHDWFTPSREAICGSARTGRRAAQPSLLPDGSGATPSCSAF